MSRRLLFFILAAASVSCTSSGGKIGGSAGNNGSGGSNGQGGATASAGANGQAGATATASAGANGQAGATASAGANGQAGAIGSAGSGAGGNGTAGVGAAGSGTAGNAGTAGAIVNAGPCGKLLPLQTSESVLTRGKNSQRTAHFVEPSLTLAAVGSAKFGADTAFNAAAKFPGSLEGVPLFVAGASPGKGMYIVASHDDHSYVTALDETTGAQLWSHNMGPSGSGMRSTPVIDGGTGTVYTAFDATTGGNHFEIHALSIATMGTEVAGWPVNASNVKSGNGDVLGSFDITKMIQRGALSLVNGVVYVPFGGVFGDGPPYKGFVVAVKASDPTQVGGWSASGDRSGLWQGGGLASDGTSMFASTSNGSDGAHKDSAAPTARGDQKARPAPCVHAQALHEEATIRGSGAGEQREEIVRITGMGVSTHNAKDAFFPSYWHDWDNHDNDIGSSSPLVAQFSGTCQALVISPSKAGHLFFVDPNNLGGADGSTALRDLLLATQASAGQLQNGVVENEYKVFYAAPTAYISASGVHVALEARVDAKCPTGSGDQLMSVKLDTTTTPATPSVAWCVPVQGGEDRHSPISTSTDGLSNAIVWFVYNSSLFAYDGDKGGTALFSGPGCGTVQKQTSPIAADGHVIVGANGKLCSYSVQP